MKILFSLGSDLSAPSWVLHSFGIRCNAQPQLSTWAPIPRRWLPTGHFLWNVPLIILPNRLQQIVQSSLHFLPQTSCSRNLSALVNNRLSHSSKKQSPLWSNLLSLPSVIQSPRTIRFSSKYWSSFQAYRSALFPIHYHRAFCLCLKFSIIKSFFNFFIMLLSIKKIKF